MQQKFVLTPLGNRLATIACAICIIVPIALCVWVFTAAAAAL